MIFTVYFINYAGKCPKPVTIQYSSANAMCQRREKGGGGMHTDEYDSVGFNQRKANATLTFVRLQE